MTDAEIKTMADSFVADLATLRTYAIETICKETPLTNSEESDKSIVMVRYFLQGRSLGLDCGDLVRLLFQGIFVHSSGCGCMVCRGRVGS